MSKTNSFCPLRPHTLGIPLGDTPQVRLTDYPNISVKLEYINEAGSHKIRPAAFMLSDAEQKGRLTRGKSKIIESTGGSMGRALCVLSAKLGYEFISVLPDNYPTYRITQLQHLGATVMLSDSTTGNDSHFKLAQKLSEENGGVFLNQIHNPNNPKAHYYTTGPEIAKANPTIDTFICGIGSSGTICGAGKFLKEKNPHIEIIGVQPEGTDSLRGLSIPHKFQGWSVGCVPSFLDASLIDGMIDVSYNEALAIYNYLRLKEGLWVGISSLGNITAAIKYSQTPGNEHKKIVTIAHDSGQNYLTEFLTIN